MHHGIFEENQVHHGVDLVVRVQGFFQDLSQVFPGGYRKVLGLSNSGGKMAVDERVSLQDFIIKILDRERRLTDGAV